MSTLWLITGIILMVGTLVLAYRPVIPPVLPCYVAMWIFDMGNIIYIGNNSLIFWGVATLMVLLINFSQPNTRNRGNGYITTGTLAGGIVGMLMSHAGIILGAALGAVMGLLAYCRTPKGNELKFPSKMFIQQLAATGLPVIVTMSIFATTLNNLLQNLLTSL